ncbi:hypothetical protein JCM18918_3652 [Cutibacterium acnes JCM 18918]|nr:hypothetical protein JCM18918_3652 [Cutibacterium acnes JCM 18918]
MTLALSSSGTLGGTAKGQWIGAICLTKVCFVAPCVGHAAERLGFGDESDDADTFCGS